MWYGLAFFHPFIEGAAELEEGEWRYGGAGYEVERVSFTVSGETFDGLKVTWFDESSSGGSWTVTVSRDLPVPYHVRWEERSGGSSVTEFELTSVSFG